ncbi:MAG: hypothetical protein GWO24_06540, partial [Akkermansiaceae bacterium]|nr:hypothetical protein [Akkermansiaceae bacterium]
MDQASHLYLFGREYDEAEALLRRLEAMEPNHDSLHLSEIMFYRDGDPTALLRRGPQARWLAKIAMGDLDAALATLYGISREEINPQGRSGAPRYPKSLFVGTTHALAGRPDEARAIFEATRQ